MCTQAIVAKKEEEVEVVVEEIAEELAEELAETDEDELETSDKESDGEQPPAEVNEGLRLRPVVRGDGPGLFDGD